ncbi:MAG: phosphoribosylformylglycinamidine synthase I [Alphaproteobacteria bacterium RIFCSPLOWO2_01_FULL_40_26]|nr:MAG: phosphoribosylformylglycinamidine synthase I [Alphaproteobacteria bacterium RIFCSPLOWO2_01_FULL_40_26]OFX09676.1 MAG: phosphoribosylformylglycinamidine synthase I [Alphaproteobacteria bacterium RIFCSPLOWO2_02_FULL_40_19]OFX10825.1 MAG: phosphoribosylformylglycinamidine synthase I [Alphaproteobacteria bacterium RIFCSPLOWO2_12_FULL_40_11]
MKAGVITFPGSNCDRDAVVALQKVGAKVQKIWHQETKLDDNFDLIIVPGGFSYGDYLRSGAMASISPVMREVKNLAKKGVRVLGICNGFQILTEAGLLPGALLRNKKMKFICRTINLRVENSASDFTAKYKKNQIIRIPIAHMDGNYFADSDVIKKLEDSQNVAFRYVDNRGNVSDESNVNGSMLNIAGIFNDAKNVLGMMPHPERAIDEDTGSKDGLLMFESLFG